MLVRLAAVEGFQLTETESPAVVAKLSELLGNKSEDKVVRVAAAVTLGQMGANAKAAPRR